MYLIGNVYNVTRKNNVQRNGIKLKIHATFDNFITHVITKQIISTLNSYVIINSKQRVKKYNKSWHKLNMKRRMIKDSNKKFNLHFIA